MSHSNSTFKRNQIVEALWPEDGKWYPARVVGVLGILFRIQFDGYVEQYDFQAHQIRELVHDVARVRGGNQRSSAKEAAPQPAPALAPISKPSATGTPQLAVGWAELQMPDGTGRRYYHNERLGLTQWDFPAASQQVHSFQPPRHGGAVFATCTKLATTVF